MKKTDKEIFVAMIKTANIWYQEHNDDNDNFDQVVVEDNVNSYVSLNFNKDGSLKFIGRN